MTARKSTASKSVVIADVFRATGAQLREAAEAGNEQAIAEVARRKANKAQPSA